MTETKTKKTKKRVARNSAAGALGGLAGTAAKKLSGRAAQLQRQQKALGLKSGGAVRKKGSCRSR